MNKLKLSARQAAAQITAKVRFVTTNTSRFGVLYGFCYPNGGIDNKQIAASLPKMHKRL